MSAMSRLACAVRRDRRDLHATTPDHAMPGCPTITVVP
jgi:hypothetical protein